MSTAINITVDDGGLPARNRQQVAANRQAFVQNVAAEKSAALGVDQRSQDRIAQGRDPSTGALLVPPISTGALGAFGGNIPRFDQQPAANRLSSSPWPELWVCDFLSPLTLLSLADNAPNTKYYRGRSKSNNKLFTYLASAAQVVGASDLAETSVANLTIKNDAKGSFLAYTPNPTVLLPGGDFYSFLATINCSYNYKDYNPEQFAVSKTLNRSTNSFKFNARTFNPSRQYDDVGVNVYGLHNISVNLVGGNGVSFSFQFFAYWDLIFASTILSFTSSTTSYELDIFSSTFANLGEWFDLELRLTNGNQYALLVNGNTLSSGILPEQVPKNQYAAYVSKNVYYQGTVLLASLSLPPIYIGKSKILFS